MKEAVQLKDQQLEEKDLQLGESKIQVSKLEKANAHFFGGISKLKADVKFIE